MTAYYNEIDPSAAAWLRELIRAGHIAPGDVDERSVEDVKPDDLRGYTQCHFFAGIGGWSLALRMAGWDDDRPVWTGSCPCQPFSTAGKGGGFADERHLWPAFYQLIAQCRPPVVFGEQVASADGLQWLDLVSADLEAAEYAFGAADLCAAGVGAPHIRQRIYWVADTMPAGSQRGEPAPVLGTRRGQEGGAVGECGGAFACGVADVHSAGRTQGHEGLPPVGHGAPAWSDRGADTDGHAGPLHGFWRAADWLACRDGKWRPVEPGTFPLGNGLPRGLVRGGDQRLAPHSSAEGRVMRLRGYGNAIVPQVAAAFVRAAM